MASMHQMVGLYGHRCDENATIKALNQLERCLVFSEVSGKFRRVQVKKSIHVITSVEGIMLAPVFVRPSVCPCLRLVSLLFLTIFLLLCCTYVLIFSNMLVTNVLVM